MAQGKKVESTIKLESIEEAVLNGEWADARLRMAARLAWMLDNTDSARDVKALSMSLIPLLEKCESDAKAVDAASNTPLADILAEAEAYLTNA